MGGMGGGGDDAAAVAALPTLVSRMHDYFVHVAARLERLHGEVGRAREAYLAARRARGDYGDPFADARPLHHMSEWGSGCGWRRGMEGDGGEGREGCRVKAGGCGRVWEGGKGYWRKRGQGGCWRVCRRRRG